MPSMMVSIIPVCLLVRGGRFFLPNRNRDSGPGGGAGVFFKEVADFEIEV